jgi:transposase
MLALTKETSIYLSSQPIDMRKSIDGLSYLVLEELNLNPQSKALYIFYNKARDKVKCLMWHKNGLILLYKRLEKGKFKFKPHPSKPNTSTINHQQLNWLLAGLDFELMKQFDELDYSHYF